MQLQADIPVTAPLPRDVPEINGWNIGEGWLPAGDPGAGPLAPSEVRQAAMSCRYAYLRSHLDTKIFFSPDMLLLIVSKYFGFVCHKAACVEQEV